MFVSVGHDPAKPLIYRRKEKSGCVRGTSCLRLQEIAPPGVWELGFCMAHEAETRFRKGCFVRRWVHRRGSLTCCGESTGYSPLHGAKWQGQLPQLQGEGKHREGCIIDGLSTPARTWPPSPPPRRLHSMSQSPAAPRVVSNTYLLVSPGCLSEMQNLNPLPDPRDQRLRFSKSPTWFLSTLKVEKLCHKELSRNTDLNTDPGPATHQLYDPGQVTWPLSFTENGDNDTT